MSTKITRQIQHVCYVCYNLHYMLIDFTFLVRPVKISKKSTVSCGISFGRDRMMYIVQLWCTYKSITNGKCFLFSSKNHFLFNIFLLYNHSPQG